MKTAAQRKKEERIRRRKEGYVMLACWVHKEDYAELKRQIGILNEHRATPAAQQLHL